RPSEPVTISLRGISSETLPSDFASPRFTSKLSTTQYPSPAAAPATAALKAGQAATTTGVKTHTTLMVTFSFHSLDNSHPDSSQILLLRIRVYCFAISATLRRGYPSFHLKLHPTHPRI